MTVGIFMPDGTEARICTEIAARQQMGINKYGTTVAQNPLSLREWRSSRPGHLSAARDCRD